MIVLLILIYLTYRICRLWTLRHQRTLSWWFGIAVIIGGLIALWLVVRQDAVAAKILGLLLMPLGLIWLALAALSAYQWVHRRWALAVILSLVFLADTVAGNAWLGAALLAHLENQIAPADIHTTSSMDAILVLGGGVNRDASGEPELGESGDRLFLAAQWFCAGKTPVLVCSGTTIPAIEGTTIDMAEESARLWRSIRIPEEAIVRVPVGATNTREEIESYKALITRHDWHRVGLISSAWHLPRAMQLCRHLGLEVIPIPADRRSRMPPFSAFWIIPQDSGCKSMQIACREYLGMLWNR